MNDVVKRLSTLERPRTGAGQPTSGRLTLPDAVRRTTTRRTVNRGVIRLTPSVVMAPATTAEVAVAQRLLAGGMGKALLRAHPYLRALEMALWIAGAYGVYREFAPQAGEIPRDPYLRDAASIPNPAWVSHPTVREHDLQKFSGYFDGEWAPPTINWSVGPQPNAYTQTKSTALARLNRVTVVNGYAYYAVGEVVAASFSYDFGEEILYRAVTSLANGRYSFTNSGVPAKTLAVPRLIYPGAAMPVPQTPTVPHAVVSQVNRWRELVQPRPDGKPQRESPSVGKVEVPAPRFPPSLVLKPHAKPAPGASHAPRPPGRGEKEKKAVTRFATAKAVMNAVTETVDVVEAVWYSLPAHLRTRNATPQQMLRDLYRNIESIDMNTALWNILLTNVQDFAMAKLSGPLQREFRKYRPDREFAFYGPV